MSKADEQVCPMFRLSDGFSELVVVVTGYERSTPQSCDDGNWLNSTISVRAQEFTGSFSASLWIGEFSHFHTELRACIDGKARSAIFQSIEDWLVLSAELSATDQVRMKCTTTSHSSPRPSLSFSMQLAYSDLISLAESIAHLLRIFPARC